MARRGEAGFMTANVRVQRAAKSHRIGQIHTRRKRFVVHCVPCPELAALAERRTAVKCQDGKCEISSTRSTGEIRGYCDC
jgi:hypothetical protein